MPNPAWLSLTLVVGGGSTLAAAAHMAPRPAACVVAEGPWQRLERPGLGRHCAALARGYAALDADPKLALGLAEGLQESPLDLDALVLEARALVSLGRYERALERFTQARARDAQAVEGTGAQHDHAVAASFAGEPQLAAKLYRGLVPQLSLLGPRRRARLLLEAALAMMRLGPEHVEEARVLVEHAARVREYREEWGVWMMVRQLAERRAGVGHSTSVQNPEALVEALSARSFDSTLPAVPAAEIAALGAAALEPLDTAKARQLWARFAADPISAPWSEWLATQIGRKP